MNNEEQEGGDRKSVAAAPTLATSRIEIAKREAANGLRQFDLVVKYVEEAIAAGRQFRLRPSILLHLNRAVLEGISGYAGNYRPSGIDITGSKHQPPKVEKVPSLVEELCDYVNENFITCSAR